MDIWDHSWKFEERETAQYRHFVLLGSKGLTQAFPTTPLKHPEDCYSREEALANAALAAKAPEMLRLLQSVERSLKVLSADDLGAQKLLEHVQAGLKSVQQECPRVFSATHPS